LLKNAMKLFFFGSNRQNRPEEVGWGVIAFAAPDIGFVFRSAHWGTALECEYQALLALCRFVEANAAVFKAQKLEVLGDSTAVVYQLSLPLDSLNGSEKLQGFPPTPTILHLREQALQFKKKLGFSVFWVPPAENRAAREVGSQPTIKEKLKLNTEFLETFKTNKTVGLKSKDRSLPY